MHHSLSQAHQRLDHRIDKLNDHKQIADLKSRSEKAIRRIILSYRKENVFRGGMHAAHDYIDHNKSLKLVDKKELVKRLQQFDDIFSQNRTHLTLNKITIDKMIFNSNGRGSGQMKSSRPHLNHQSHRPQPKPAQKSRPKRLRAKPYIPPRRNPIDQPKKKRFVLFRWFNELGRVISGRP